MPDKPGASDLPARPPHRRTFQLTLTDAGGPDSTPVIIRLRHVLKSLLRQYHMRCTRAVELDQDGKEIGLETTPETPRP